MYSTRILGQNKDEGKKRSTRPDETRPKPPMFLLIRYCCVVYYRASFLPTENLEQASADHTKGVF